MSVGQWFPSSIGTLNMLCCVDATSANPALVDVTYYKADGSAPDVRVKPATRWVTYTGQYYATAADASAARSA